MKEYQFISVIFSLLIFVYLKNFEKPIELKQHKLM